MQRGAKFGKNGFTLIEVLVVLLLISLLVAAVVPQVAQQTDEAEPVRAAADLAAVKTGLEAFKVNVRVFPSDLEDLANKISTSDENVNGTTYASKFVDRWLGPYIDKAFAAGNDVTQADAFETGFDGQVQKKPACYHADSTTITAFEEAGASGACDTGEFVAILITGLSSTEFESLNDIIDGEAETSTNTTGRLRSFINGTAPDTVFFLAVPFTE
ncbi:MAG: prepilin-type N-terminal cleavage/methylation domain-containing protein [Gemmatimonadetes bacterium]|nr:prepilin-type N-terminal cleavage/methylation domain-containing protein [Gemmatimonadota bacterium]